jgi:hypothetical protein
MVAHLGVVVSMKPMVFILSYGEENVHKKKLSNDNNTSQTT